MLDRIRKNRFLSSIIMALAAFIAAMIIWPLFDLLWAKIITHSEFIYTFREYVVEPAIFAVIFGIIAYFIWKPETKFDRKSEKHPKK
ncbi:hypothetical protein IKG06_03415 [Candidatus Saccharibacteria bacterium]|nr:hypothetical protein [Candidatus Saccharibacteria bacterium]